MIPASSDRPLALLAILSALTVIALLAAAFSAGISQEVFQAARLAEPNAVRLGLNPAGLRLNIGLDNLFIVLYSTFFVLLTVRLKDVLPAPHRYVALAALMLTALLDAVENHHILAMLFSAEQDIPLTTGESQFQMAASFVKFQASYVGMFLYAFGLYRLGGLGRPLAWGIWLVYVPIGLVIYMVPPEASRSLVLARAFCFIAAFACAAAIFRRPANAA